MRTPTRTDLYEDHQAEVRELRAKAVALRTAARAYVDLAEQIDALPSRGGIADACRAEIVEACHAQANIAMTLSADATDAADAKEATWR